MGNFTVAFITTQPVYRTTCMSWCQKNHSLTPLSLGIIEYA